MKGGESHCVPSDLRIICTFRERYVLEHQHFNEEIQIMKMVVRLACTVCFVVRIYTMAVMSKAS